MVANNLTAGLDLIILWEGSEINIANTEPGGISKYGISLVAYSDYCKANNLQPPTFDTISNLTETDARGFYGNWWLPKMRFNDLPSGVDVRLADISVNLGVRGAINCLELFLQHFPLVGTIDDKTIAELNNYTARELILGLSATWIAVKHTSPNWNPPPNGRNFGHGWSNRNISVTQQCLKLGANK